MELTIPLTKPYKTGLELTYIAEAIDSGRLAADGAFTQRCSQLLSETFGISKVLMTPSGTAALEMAALLCDLQPGDEVILPSFTFVSTASAILRAGGKPIFIDIRPDTLNLDERLIESAINSRTKAIVPVHYGGIGCDMERIMALAQKHNLKVIEDAAQAVNSSYQGRSLGSIGNLGTFSFHHTKNYICGEGGALCVNDPSMVERAEILREKGTNRTQFIRGQVDKYTWVDLGSSYLPSEINCAFLYAQLLQLDWITSRRREVYEFYSDHLRPLEKLELLRLPVIPESCKSNYHVFYVILPDYNVREGLMSHLKQNGIEATFHYVPLHSSPMGSSLGYQAGDFPVTEDLSSRLLRLPIYPDLTPDEQSLIVHHLNGYLQNLDVKVLVEA
ncbi:MAG TPA: dTDP-4-amino-4,6-dideoxygalactose transaminase [Pyrinomonadaceae bacterium]|nr:dTDP-4-amino-4,6-dideoxygalactose transaminase [Pyrinomonadaceae bacterium]